MLLRNWEIFDPSDVSGKYAADIEHYTKATKGIKNKYGSMGFIRFVNTQVAADLKGQPIPPCTVPLVAREGLTEWAYTQNVGNIRRSDKGIVSLTRKSLIMKTGDLNVDVEKDIDLAYFLIEKSPLFKKGTIKIDDVREREEAEVKAKRDAIKLNSAIYGDASPLSSEGTLRQVCSALGISGADKATDSALRIKLEGFIGAENKKHDVRAMTTENFLDFINMGEEVNKRGIVGKAVQRKVIEYSKMRGWHWGTSQETIVRVPETRVGDKFAYLCEYYGSESNAEAFDGLIKELTESGYFQDDQPHEEMKFLAKRYGIKIAQTSKKELAEKIVEHFKV